MTVKTGRWLGILLGPLSFFTFVMILFVVLIYCLPGNHQDDPKLWEMPILAGIISLIFGAPLGYAVVDGMITKIEGQMMVVGEDSQILAVFEEPTTLWKRDQRLRYRGVLVSYKAQETTIKMVGPRVKTGESTEIAFRYTVKIEEGGTPENCLKGRNWGNPVSSLIACALYDRHKEVAFEELNNPADQNQQTKLADWVREVCISLLEEKGAQIVKVRFWFA